MLSILRRFILRLLGAPPEIRDIFNIVDGRVERVLLSKDGVPIHAVTPGSQADPFSVLHKRDTPSRLRTALYRLHRKEYEAARQVLEDTLWVLERKGAAK